MAAPAAGGLRRRFPGYRPRPWHPRPAGNDIRVAGLPTDGRQRAVTALTGDHRRRRRDRKQRSRGVDRACDPRIRTGSPEAAAICAMASLGLSTITRYARNTAAKRDPLDHHSLAVAIPLQVWRISAGRVRLPRPGHRRRARIAQRACIRHPNRRLARHLQHAGDRTLRAWVRDATERPISLPRLPRCIAGRASAPRARHDHRGRSAGSRAGLVTRRQYREPELRRNTGPGGAMRNLGAMYRPIPDPRALAKACDRSRLSTAILVLAASLLALSGLENQG